MIVWILNISTRYRQGDANVTTSVAMVALIGLILMAIVLSFIGA